VVSVQFPQYKKQQKLLIALGVLILAIILVLYFGLWRQPSQEELLPEIIGPVPSGAEEDLELDKDFFEDPRYQGLKFYGQWPIEVGEVGRENPFLPY